MSARFDPDTERISDGQQARAQARAAALGSEVELTREGWRLRIGSRVVLFELWDHVVRALEVASPTHITPRAAR